MKKELKYRLRRVVFLYTPFILLVTLIEMYAFVKAGIFVFY